MFLEMLNLDMDGVKTGAGLEDGTLYYISQKANPILGGMQKKWPVTNPADLKKSFFLPARSALLIFDL